MAPNRPSPPAHLTPVKSAEGPENVYDSASPVHVVPTQKPPPKLPNPEQSICESLHDKDIDSGLCVPQPTGNTEENIYEDVDEFRQSTASLSEGHYEFVNSASMEGNHNFGADHEDV